MKIIKLAAVIAAFAVVIGCGSTSPSSGRSSGVNTGGSSRISAGGDELDRAIRETSDYLNRRIAKGTKVVFLNVNSDWPDLSEYILFGLMENAVNDDLFSVVDRQQLDLIRAEQNFQYSGEVSDTSAQEIGQMLGAQTIVSGSVSTIGSIYRIQTRAIAVQTAAVQGQFSQNVSNKNDTIAALTERKASAGSSTAAAASRTTTGTQTAQTPAASGAATTPAATATPAQTTTTSYKIGDKGPAGGLIFYDKGNTSNGWRYLEAAPVEAEFQARMSVRDTFVENTQTAIGNGKRNTQLIVEKFKQTSGEWDTAAQKVDDLVFNGFNDWFLPSQAELDQMYGNLQRRNLGEFKKGWYWTSSMLVGDFGNLNVHVQDFSDGAMNTRRITSTSSTNVRPIRQF